MIKISHRGNLVGPSKRENHPDHIHNALYAGYWVEVDVWKIGKGLYLGHDKPTYETFSSWLMAKKNLLCHAKNPESLHFLLESGFHCFWHEEDKYTITSKGIPIVYPGQVPIPNSIIMLPEKGIILPNVYGICSDYIGSYN